MAETQEKRTDGSMSGDNDVKNQTGNSVQNNTQTAGASSGTKGSTGGQSNDKLGDVLGSVPGTKEIIKQAKETAGQAYEKVSEQASSQIVTQKENLARGLSSVADGIKQMGESIRNTEQQTPIAGFTAKYGDSLAQQVEQVASYLEKKDLHELVRDVEVFARRNPAVFIGGAFALGIAAARFLKSGNPNQALMRRPRRQREGIYIPDASEGVYLPEDLSRKVGLADTSSETSNRGGTGSGISGSGTSSTGSGTAGDKTTTGGTTSTTDRTSSDAFSTNKGG